MSHRGRDTETSDPFVSTGTLPPPDRVQQLMEDAFGRYRGNEEGATSRVYPALGRASPQLFGLCVMGANGDRYESGDADVEFSIMSVSKPFVFALVCNALGSDRVRDFVGVNATGLPFNSIEAIGLRDDGRTNPMVNAGAIATSSLFPGSTAEARWHAIQTGLSRCAGRTLEIDEEIFASATATNDRNRSIVEVLASSDRLVGQASEVLDLYTRQSSLRVTARDLAVMGATMADGGVNPLTHERVVDAASCRATLATMTTAGLYETSGDWLFDVGLPGKSGIGGGIVTVSPGKGALGTYAPLLDDAGNSVKGQLAARFLSQRLGLDLFASEPAR